MARVRLDEADRYGGSGGAGFFQLKNDGDKAKVRIMYDTIDDVDVYSVHEIDAVDENGRVIMGKNNRPVKKYVNCLRKYDDPIDDCPFCREGRNVTVKIFIPIYNIDQDKVQIWERGKNYSKRLARIASKYDSIVSQVFEIERDGAAGYQKTEYYIEPVGKPDGTTLEDLPPIEKFANLLEKSADDMEYYLQEGQFPPSDDDYDQDEDDEPPVRRGRSNNNRGRNRDAEEAPTRRSRRTPASRRNHDDDDEAF